MDHATVRYTAGSSAGIMAKLNTITIIVTITIKNKVKVVYEMHWLCAY